MSDADLEEVIFKASSSVRGLIHLVGFLQIKRGRLAQLQQQQQGGGTGLAASGGQDEQRKYVNQTPFCVITFSEMLV